MAKKTISVESIKAKVNKAILHSPDENRGERKGLAFLLESVLHETGNYKGFSYLNNLDMADSLNGETPGIIFGENGADHQFPDETRRAYY